MSVKSIFATFLAVYMIVLLCFFVLPLFFPFLFLYYPLYRKGVSWVTALYLAFFSFLLESFWGVRYIVSGDRLEEDASLILSNHRTRLDWAMLWPVLCRSGLLSALRIVLKADLRRIPILGWGLQMLGYVFLNRDWEKDEEHFLSCLRAISRRSVGGAVGEDAHYSILIFPEGTDLHPAALEKSGAYADKLGLSPHLQQVLYPRSTGFCAAINELRAPSSSSCTPLDCVYDVTLAYSGKIAQKESNLLSGNMPTAVHCHVRRWPLETLPTDSKLLADWLRDRFLQKEAALGKFYAELLAEGVASLDVTCTDSSTQRLTTSAAATTTASGAAASYFFSVIFFLTLSLTVCLITWRYPLHVAIYAVSIFLIFHVILPKVTGGGIDVLERKLRDPQPPTTKRA